MKIKHHGAVSGVTGSCHQLHMADGSSVLIDCGLFQGAETSPQGGNAERLGIDFDIGRVDALIVTHVHIDHVGRIPHLLAAGFEGPIYCSEPSAVLLPLVLEDAVKIGFTRDKALLEGFQALIKQRIVPLGYGDWAPVNACLRIRLQPAGHILGSAYVECDVREANQKPHRVVFSGDLGAPYAPLLPAPKSPYGCDTLVIESTYGDRLHEQRRTRRDRLQKIIETALKDNGVVLIPAFSIGRTQELLYEIEALIHDNAHRYVSKGLAWEALDIIVDSPLAAEFNEVYTQLKSYWDAEARQRVRRGRHPLSFDNLLTVQSHQDHLKVVNYLASTAKPAIVIAASGMCTGGRILNYLKRLLGDSRTDIVFVGYQAEGTPGREIQRYGARGGYVMLEGQRYEIAAGVHTLSGYSAHADQKDLVNFVKRMRKKPTLIKIVHGDVQAKQQLAERLKAWVAEGGKVEIPQA
ncbi:MAG: MBL fold metallo-hydrolase [Hahellaceae bacterium]|nr:MBL fold metallo-hydrolase [Hahellaceae bacterium]MCP5170606.1 MBL fold metallo-hydrolase [Hahellaceae bacterium]